MRQVSNLTIRPRRALRLAVPRIVMLVTLLAFSIQTYLTQTHIHWAPEHQAPYAQAPGNAKGMSHKPAAPKDGYPANEDPANCPLCHELVHAGQFVMPAAAALLLPLLPATAIQIVAPAAILVEAVTHIWRGRAPPIG